MKESKEPGKLFNPGKARWVCEKGKDELTDLQQALILAMAQLETELGREMSDEERQALETLASQMDGFDPQDITKAMQKVVRSPADPKRKTSWPELKRHKK